MITHFQYQPLFSTDQIPGWRFTFYFQKVKFTGIYHQNGSIEWIGQGPNEEAQKTLEKQVHELMLFHVYDK